MTNNVGAALAALAAHVRAATVRVTDERARGAGSGVVWAPGLVITNAHVVRGRSASVEWNGERFGAEVLRRDAERDVAALRIASDAPRPATVRDSSTLVPGELVVAVGNPLGLTAALTTGVVQRANRRWVVADVRLEPGNSGGPLADSDGRVVGINSMVAGRLALAIPTAAVAAFLDGSQGRLGVALTPVAARVGGTRLAALLVTAVEPHSVAERAGVRLGDTIVLEQPWLAAEPQRAVAALRDATSLEVIRGGARIVLPLQWPEGRRAA